MKALTVSDIEAAIGKPAATWYHQCHAISLAIVKSGIVEGRVARGTCQGVVGQHSWVTLGDDCYNQNTPILDATLWSYQDRDPYLYMSRLGTSQHQPHGVGSIWAWGCPAAGDGPIITLNADLSEEAEDFLFMVGPLDRQGWAMLASQAPVEGWPAAEILTAMADTPAVAALVPIDRLGMLTDRNPSGLYLRST